MNISKSLQHMPKRTHPRMQKTCQHCGDLYIGTKASRLCSKRECKTASNRAWGKRHLSETLDRRKARQREQGIEPKEHNTQQIKSEVKVFGVCNNCGSTFEPESKYHQYCNNCKRTKAYEKQIIINRIEYSVKAVIEAHLGENEGLMQTIEQMYPNHDQLEQQRIFDECYHELLKRYSQSYFEENEYENQECNMPVN